jgi:methylmalonyl-CoA mutase N-terminal domain/subunit
MIAERAYGEQLRLESGERPLVGVNRYRRDEPPPQVEFYAVDEAERSRQVERLRAIRARRDAGRASSALAELRRGARGTANLMPLLVEACLAYCTLGEMVDVLRDEFGEFQEPAVV